MINESIAREFEFVINDRILGDSYEVRLSLGVEVAVNCRCGEVHYCTRPLTPAEKRERNRKMVAWQQNVAAYLTFGQAEDAWQSRTLNLDGMIDAGRI